MENLFSLSSQQTDAAMEVIRALQSEAYDNAEEHGFHKAYSDLLTAVPVEERKSARRTILLAKLALIASEVGEAVREVQHGDEQAMAVELADVVIRVLDMCGAEYIELGSVMLAKMMRNRKRPYLHGKEC